MRGCPRDAVPPCAHGPLKMQSLTVFVPSFRQHPHIDTRPDIQLHPSLGRPEMACNSRETPFPGPTYPGWGAGVQTAVICQPICQASKVARNWPPSRRGSSGMPKESWATKGCGQRCAHLCFYLVCNVGVAWLICDLLRAFGSGIDSGRDAKEVTLPQGAAGESPPPLPLLP